MAAAHDLDSDLVLQQYLSSINVVPSSVQNLTGGSANYCWRVTLGPHSQATGISLPEGIRTVIVKHAEAFVATLVP